MRLSVVQESLCSASELMSCLTDALRLPATAAVAAAAATARVCVCVADNDKLL